MDLHDFRTSYLLGKLSRKDLSSSPVTQFKNWFDQLLTTDLRDPSAMILATVNSEGHPSQRYVLLKQFDEQGFVFFTDTSSVKGQEIAANKYVSLLFPWHIVERQVRIQGVAQRLDEAEAVRYFQARPIDSQLAAASSLQSQTIESRVALEKEYGLLKAQHKGQDKIDKPDRWGGYRVIPTSFEFWQGGEHRLHDRFRYQKKADNWQIDRLQP